jgi:hypothetical protein
MNPAHIGDYPVGNPRTGQIVIYQKKGIKYTGVLDKVVRMRSGFIAAIVNVDGRKMSFAVKNDRVE